eukprot:2843534-Rhodomonas_salina.1
MSGEGPRDAHRAEVVAEVLELHVERAIVLVRQVHFSAGLLGNTLPGGVVVGERPGPLARGPRVAHLDQLQLLPLRVVDLIQPQDAERMPEHDAVVAPVREEALELIEQLFALRLVLAHIRELDGDGALERVAELAHGALGIPRGDPRVAPVELRPRLLHNRHPVRALARRRKDELGRGARGRPEGQPVVDNHVAVFAIAIEAATVDAGRVDLLVAGERCLDQGGRLCRRRNRCEKVAVPETPCRSEPGQ